MNMAFTIDRTLDAYHYWLRNEATMSELLCLLPSDLILEAVPSGIRLEYNGWVHEGMPRDTIIEFLTFNSH